MDLTKSVENWEIYTEIFYNVDINPSYRLDTGIYIYIYLPVYRRCTCYLIIYNGWVFFVVMLYSEHNSK